MQYAAYMLQKRADVFNVLHHANRLAQEWMVQTYGVLELQRLIWHWTHQDTIRADLYQARTKHSRVAAQLPTHHVSTFQTASGCLQFCFQISC